MTDCATQVFAGPGVTRALCRTFDWAATPLGPVEAWPRSLRTIAATALASAFPKIILWGPDLVQIYNDGYIPILGAKHPAGMGRPTRECWPESWAFNEPIYARVFQGETVSFEDQLYQLLRGGPDKPPEDVHITLSYSPVPGDDGRVGGVLVTLIETTARVTARALEAERERLFNETVRLLAAAEAAELQFRTLADAMPTLAWTATPDGYLDWYNARWYEYTGTTPEQMEGWGWQSVHDPEILPQVLERWRAGIATGEPMEMTFPLRGADGKFRSFLTRTVPLKDADGRVIRWIGSNTDVDVEHGARTAAEAERIQAAASEARYRTLTEVMPVQIWTATPDGALDYVGEQTCEYFGTSAGDLLGAGWLRFVHPSDLDRAAMRWSHALTTGSPYEAEFRLLGNDGDYRWHIARARPTRSAWGEITGWVGTNTDVEAERRARAEAEAAGLAAETASRAKSDFLAVMSHELRTPLNAIGGYTELISMGIRGPVTEAQLEDLARITRSQQHLLGLINDLLNMARLDAGKVSYDIADIPLSAAMDRVEELILPQLTARGLKYARAACDPALCVRADAEKLRQVLVNVLSNATKYTDTGSVTVECDVTDESASIRVRDTGPGIAPDQLGRIFEPFVQISGSGRPREGVGLGLAISRDLARGMRGELTADSTLGAGSIFTLTLPRSHSDKRDAGGQ
ncbi:MAG: PAS domain-containing sensor histidine kinase [Gemmatimonadota bacterium]|nr:PAS domain-containing sensor histidine kinase [Gemmatimonadota bacterium]